MLNIKKYYCSYCDDVFDDDELEPIYEADMDYIGDRLVTRGHYCVGAACPRCGGEDCIQEAEQCDICEEYYGIEDYMIKACGLNICVNCAEEIATTYIHDFGLIKKLKDADAERTERLAKLRCKYGLNRGGSDGKEKDN